MMNYMQRKYGGQSKVKELEAKYGKLSHRTPKAKPIQPSRGGSFKFANEIKK